MRIYRYKHDYPLEIHEKIREMFTLSEGNRILINPEDDPIYGGGIFIPEAGHAIVGEGFEIIILKGIYKTDVKTFEAEIWIAQDDWALEILGR